MACRARARRARDLFDAGREGRPHGLIQRDEEMQRRLNELASRQQGLEKATSRGFDELQAELTKQFEARLTKALAKYRSLRAAGAVLLPWAWS